jgi:putative DNA primase/helicase
MTLSTAVADTNNISITLSQIAKSLGGEISGSHVKAPGPGHSHEDRSLSVTLEPAAPRGFLVYSHAGDDDIKCKDYVREKCGLPSWRPRVSSAQKDVDYIYKDEHSLPYIKITRRYKTNGRKDFPQSRWDGKAWVFGTKDMPKVPYLLPALLARKDDPIFFVEGEKDADRLTACGLLSTTASEGASAKWKPELTKWFTGRDVYIIPDNDKPGEAHAEKVARALKPVASSVRIIHLSDLPEKGDVSDWLNAGGDIDLIKLSEAAPLWAANDNFSSSNTSPGNFSLGVITEDAVASRFVEVFANKLRYCHSTGAWFEWNDVVWRRNETKLAFHWSRLLARELSDNDAPKEMKAAQKASFARAVEAFSQADTTLAVTIDNWDRDPFKLGTPGGTVDLKTGLLSQPDRADGITKLVAVAPVDTVHCPLWLKFLDETTGNDVELIRYLQQWCGYCLTGDIREHALVFVYGGGAVMAKAFS